MIHAIEQKHKRWFVSQIRNRFPNRKIKWAKRNDRLYNIDFNWEGEKSTIGEMIMLTWWTTHETVSKTPTINIWRRKLHLSSKKLNDEWQIIWNDFCSNWTKEKTQKSAFDQLILKSKPYKVITGVVRYRLYPYTHNCLYIRNT